MTISMLAFWAYLGAPAVAAWQTTPLTGATGDDFVAPITLVASAEAVLPASSTMVVWLVERLEETEAASRSETSLAYALPRQPLPNMHGEHGAARATSAAGRAVRLTPGETLPLLEATADAGLSVRFSIVPQDSLSPGALASAPFAALGDHLLLELREGRLAPGQQISIPTRETPVMLLVVDNPLQIEQGIDPALKATRGELTLLTSDTTIHNAGARVATFVIAWIVTNDAGADQTASADVPLGVDDVELDHAWKRFGCHRNPGNPACLTVGLAAACASAPGGPGCSDDSDADTCRDIAEVRAGLDPFQPTDCIGGREGEPLLNCLFPTGNLSCDGSHDVGGELDCPAVDQYRVRDADETDACGQNPGETEIDCRLFERDPMCDGFGLQARQAG